MKNVRLRQARLRQGCFGARAGIDTAGPASPRHVCTRAARPGRVVTAIPSNILGKILVFAGEKRGWVNEGPAGFVLGRRRLSSE